jgi:Fe-S-cluster containining protein
VETLEQGGHLFPGIWRHLLPEEFTWQTPPREHRATCDDCYLVTLGDFAADCQCCTYSPQIPNFLVGLALKDPRSRDAMMRQIEAGGALPRELVNAPGRFRRALALHEYGRFGRDTEATCRFYDRRTTQCRIYPYRNSVCSTFICAHDHGEDGEYYWERLQQLVGHLEQAVAQWAMGQAGYEHDRYIERLNALADRVESCTDPATETWSAEARRWLWGDRAGREVEFFVRCADVVLERREDLYSIACATRVRQAIVFEQAVADWMPAELRRQVPTVADDEYAAEPIPSLFYKLQLATRALWKLPFGEAPVALAPGLVVECNPGDDPVAQANASLTHVVRVGDERIFLSSVEAAALRLFEQPRILDERLLARPEITALPEPREVLAAWLRRAVLETKSCAPA